MCARTVFHSFRGCLSRNVGLPIPADRKSTYRFFFQMVEARAQSAVEVHRANLKTYRKWLAYFKSNATCLTCLDAKPEHVLTCGHSICDTCIKKFGTELTDYEYRFRIETCVLCSNGSLLAMVKPPSAGVTLLSIDGGGNRGLIPLKFLGRIQKVLGDCPIQNVVDMAFGTSSGNSLILL